MKIAFEGTLKANELSRRRRWEIHFLTDKIIKKIIKII
jgi:hypothetical protein